MKSQRWVPSLEGLSNSARSMAHTLDITIEAWHPVPGGREKALCWLQIPEAGSGEGGCRTYGFGKAHTAHSSVKHAQAQHM